MTAILFTLCILAALGVFFYQLWRRFQLLRSAAAVSRFDRIPERVRAVLVYAFGQRKFVRRNPGAERSAGWMHFFIFWGFHHPRDPDPHDVRPCLLRLVRRSRL